jgi:hypothetical protein
MAPRASRLAEAQVINRCLLSRRDAKAAAVVGDHKARLDQARDYRNADHIRSTSSAEENDDRREGIPSRYKPRVQPPHVGRSRTKNVRPFAIDQFVCSITLFVCPIILFDDEHSALAGT